MNSIVPRKLSNREMKALEGSIREQIGASITKLKGNIEAIFLWKAYEEFDLDVEELEALLESFQRDLKELMDFYGIEGAEDIEFACVHNLKLIGFDTEKLGKAFPVEWTINGRK